MQHGSRGWLRPDIMEVRRVPPFLRGREGSSRSSSPSRGMRSPSPNGLLERRSPSPSPRCRSPTPTGMSSLGASFSCASLAGERQILNTMQPFDRAVATSPQRFSQAFQSRSPRFAPRRCFSGNDPRAIQADDPFSGHAHQYQLAESPGDFRFGVRVKEPRRLHSAFLATPRPPFAPPCAYYETGAGTGQLRRPRLSHLAHM